MPKSNAHNQRPMLFNVFKLCNLVENYPCLYDQDLPDYARKDVVDKAWREISYQMKEPIAECKTRWYNIRGTFSKHINSKIQTVSENGTKKKYYLEDALSFLRPHIRSRSSIRSRYSQESTSQETFQENHYEEPESENIEVPRMFEPAAESSRKRAKNEIIPDFEEDESDDPLPRMFNNDLPENNEQCAEMYFLKSLLPDLKMMAPEQQHRFRVQTLSIIGEILYQTSVYSPEPNHQDVHHQDVHHQDVHQDVPPDLPMENYYNDNQEGMQEILPNYNNEC